MPNPGSQTNGKKKLQNSGSCIVERAPAGPLGHVALENLRQLRFLGSRESRTAFIIF